MADFDSITLMESLNDGGTIHLYADAASGTWRAFGISAYNVKTLEVGSVEGFSRQAMMPAVVISGADAETLCKRCAAGKSSSDHLILRGPVASSSDGYAAWARQLRAAAKI